MTHKDSLQQNHLSMKMNFSRPNCKGRPSELSLLNELQYPIATVEEYQCDINLLNSEWYVSSIDKMFSKNDPYFL